MAVNKAIPEKLETALVSAGRSKKFTQGSVNTVIQRASSLVFESVKAKNMPRSIGAMVSCSMAAGGH